LCCCACFRTRKLLAACERVRCVCVYVCVCVCVCACVCLCARVYVGERVSLEEGGLVEGLT
jgi:hypothetical protein